MMRGKFISMALAFAMCASVLGGCGGNVGDPKKDTTNNIIYEDTARYEGGTHLYQVGETSHKLLEAGTSSYRIVIPEDASVTLKTAVSELTTLFREATGVTLATATDAKMEWSEDVRAISLGKSKFQQDSGVEVPEGLKSNGFVIETAGASVVVFGGLDLGTQFGVYELMHQLFGFVRYGVDTYYLETGVTDKVLPDFKIYDNPDFDYTGANYGSTYGDSEAAHRMRTETVNEIYMTATAEYVHNTMDYLPPAQYEEKHPEWYATNTTPFRQLCYTAHGDGDEYSAMVAEMTEKVKIAIDKEPEKSIISITNEDTITLCNCEWCVAVKDKYGTDAAANIMFINDVAAKIESWLNNERGGRKVTIAMFAYNASVTPPAVKDASGNWQPIDDKVVTRDNVCVIFAPISVVNFNYDYSDEQNAGGEDRLKAWEACSSSISVWNYSTHFGNYFMPYDTFQSCQNQYRRYLEAGAIWIFDNAAWDSKNVTGFQNLKLFLNAQWAWDVNQSYNELVDGFFANYYGSKDGAMRKMFDEMRAHLGELTSRDGVGSRTSDDLFLAEYWPFRLLERWISFCDEAEKEIAGLEQSAPEKYRLFMDHIALERLMPQYMMLKLHPFLMSETEKKTLQTSFAAECRRLGVTRESEQTTIDGMIGEW